LASDLFEGDVVAELYHRFVPSKSVQVDGVQQRPVEIEDGGFRHLNSSGADRTIFTHQSA
jgi:hypothetical protein